MPVPIFNGSIKLYPIVQDVNTPTQAIVRIETEYGSPLNRIQCKGLNAQAFDFLDSQGNEIKAVVHFMNSFYLFTCELEPETIQISEFGKSLGFEMRPFNFKSKNQQ